jgi:hypothetical protein
MMKYAFHYYSLFIAVLVLLVAYNSKCFQLSAAKFGVNRTKNFFKLLKISGFLLFGALVIKLMVIYLN